MSLDKNSSTQASGSNLAFTLVADESGETLPTAQDLRAALEKGTDELKLDTLRRIIISTLNGAPQVRSSSLAYRRDCRARGGWAGGGGGITLTRPRHSQPTLLMPIIQFVLPSKNKHIKKLLQ